MAFTLTLTLVAILPVDAFTSSIVVTASAAPPKNRYPRTLTYPWHLKGQNSDRYPEGEVIGSAGKIGSYVLNQLNTPIDPPKRHYPQSLHAAAVPRGVAPGCLSPDDTPIYACVPSSSIRDVWDSTLPHRRKDLVFLCNCIPSRHLNLPSEGSDGVSVAVLHFGVSNAEASSTPTPRLNSSIRSPPTVVYGRHAQALASLLRKGRIPVRLASDPREVQVAAARKLAWSSLLWLLCHGADDGGELVTAKTVHRCKSNELQKLVEEILPSLEILSSEPWMKNDNCDEAAKTELFQSIGSVQDILEYLRSYSMSISNGNVIPSRELALREIRERNWLLLSLAADEKRQNSYHLDLLRRVAGEGVLARCLQARPGLLKDVDETVGRIRCTSSNLELLFRSSQSAPRKPNAANSVVVVGAGMVGSSIAYHLSMRGVNVTVMDQRKNLVPPGDGGSLDIHPGSATSSSFAWLNANDKSPLPYKQLNQLGMEVWRRHSVLKHIPVWSGSLVRTPRPGGDEGEDKTPSLKNGPYYLCVGPLGCEEAQLLEPGVDWPCPVSGTTEDIPSAKESDIHFYPEEGHVDPFEAVKALRLSAHKNGVEFLEGATIDHLVRDQNGKVIGVQYVKSDTAAFYKADIVVIAAGANSSDAALGIDSEHLQMLEQPGVLAYAKSAIGNNAGSTNELKTLQRIFVDTVAQAHILRRSDGTIVVGGGQLVVGGGHDPSLDGTSIPEDGTSASLSPQWPEREDEMVGNAMIETAVAAMAPFELRPLSPSSDRGSPGHELIGVSRADRPMPSDGLPVIGFADRCLYVAVMHSGITLGPLVGELAAFELWDMTTAENEEECRNDGNGFQILNGYRPSESRTKN